MSQQTICLVLALAIAGAVLLSFGTPVLASPSDKFAACCQKIEGLSPATIKDECKFIPNNPSPDEAHEIAQHFKEYVGCYTNHKNNRDCCAKAGVVGPYAYCQDLCDGTDDIQPDPKYYVCEKLSIRKAVSGCNEAAYGPGGSGEMQD